jgi:DNA polymerase III epsilon subunit-like protein
VWFADVEIHFLSAIFGGSVGSWRRRTIDVRNLAIEADGVPRSARAQLGYGLSWVAGRLGVPVADPHDALDDALVAAQAFLVLATRLPDAPDPTVADLLRAAGSDRARS